MEDFSGQCAAIVCFEIKNKARARAARAHTRSFVGKRLQQTVLRKFGTQPLANDVAVCVARVAATSFRIASYGGPIDCTDLLPRNAQLPYDCDEHQDQHEDEERDEGDDVDDDDEDEEGGEGDVDGDCYLLLLASFHRSTV